MLLLSVYYLANVYDETTRRIELLAAGGQMNFENDCGSVSNGVWANTTAHRRSPSPRRTCRAYEHSTKLAYGDNGILSGVMAGGTPI